MKALAVSFYRLDDNMAEHTMTHCPSNEIFHFLTHWLM